MSFAKVRVDGAVARASNSGFLSDVCINSNGVYLGSSAISITGITDPASLEALACREALALTTDLMLCRIVIASDYKGVIDDINNATRGIYGNVVREIEVTASNF